VTSKPDFNVTILFNVNSKMVQDRATVTMTDQHKVIHASNHAIFNNLERPQTQISRWRVYYRCPQRIVCTADTRSVCDS